MIFPLADIVTLMLVLVWPCSFVGRATLIQSECREFNSFPCQSFSLFFGRPNGMTSAKPNIEIAKYSTSLYPIIGYFSCQEPDFLPSQYYENQYFIMRLDGGGCRQNHSLGNFLSLKGKKAPCFSSGRRQIFQRLEWTRKLNVTRVEEHKKQSQSGKYEPIWIPPKLNTDPPLPKNCIRHLLPD